jgi:hypothetical protein
MPGSNCETWRQICGDLGGNILVEYCGRITASDYMDILGNQVHPMVQILFPNNDTNFFRWHVTHTHRQKCSVVVWGTWRSTSTSSLASTIASLKYHPTTVVTVRSRSPPPSFLNQLEDVLCEGWYNVPLEIVQNLYESISRRAEAVLHANGGPTLY